MRIPGHHQDDDDRFLGNHKSPQPKATHLESLGPGFR